jgi:hypothetical protein
MLEIELMMMVILRMVEEDGEGEKKISNNRIFLCGVTLKVLLPFTDDSK